MNKKFRPAVLYMNYEGLTKDEQKEVNTTLQANGVLFKDCICNKFINDDIIEFVFKYEHAK